MLLAHTPDGLLGFLIPGKTMAREHHRLALVVAADDV
jgi:hypothetical protein